MINNNNNSIIKQAEFLKGEKKKMLTIVSDISKMLMEHNLDLSDKPTYGISLTIDGFGNHVEVRIYEYAGIVFLEKHEVSCLNMIFNNDSFGYYWDYEREYYIKKINETIDKLNLMKSTVKKYIRLNEKNNNK